MRETHLYCQRTGVNFVEVGYGDGEGPRILYELKGKHLCIGNNIIAHHRTTENGLCHYQMVNNGDKFVAPENKLQLLSAVKAMSNLSFNCERIDYVREIDGKEFIVYNADYEYHTKSSILFVAEIDTIDTIVELPRNGIPELLGDCHRIQEGLTSYSVNKCYVEFYNDQEVKPIDILSATLQLKITEEAI